MNKQAQLSMLRNQLKEAKEPTWDGFVRSILRTTVTVSVFAVFPALSVLYPSAWFMAHLSLILYTLIMCAAVGFGYKQYENLTKGDRQLIDARKAIYRKSMYPSWTRAVTTLPVLLFCAFIAYVGYPVYAALIFLLSIATIVSGQTIRNMVGKDDSNKTESLDKDSAAS